MFKVPKHKYKCLTCKKVRLNVLFFFFFASLWILTNRFFYNKLIRVDLRGYVYNKSEPAHKHKKKVHKTKRKKKASSMCIKVSNHCKIH